MADSVADMFTIIRNANAVGKETVIVPHSKFKMEIAKFLQKEKYLKEAVKRGKKLKKNIEITLSYKNNEPVITEIKKISKPSCRVYYSLKDLRSMRKGRGIMILSTPKGILSNQKAIKEKTGGEVVGEIY
jgi:small subunit ribosomal protein S8